MAEADPGFRDSIREAEAYKSPYELWKESEGVPTTRGLHVPNLYEMELAPWKSRGGSAAFINLEGTGGVNSRDVGEISPHEHPAPCSHISHETIIIPYGHGAP